MAFSDIFFDPQNDNQYNSNYYVVDQNNCNTNNINGAYNQIIFINYPCPPQNQDCNVYNYYASNSNSNSNNSNNNGVNNSADNSSIQQQNVSLLYENTKENQVFYTSQPVKEYASNYRSLSSLNSILVHEAQCTNAPASNLYGFQTNVLNQSYQVMASPQQTSEYSSGYTYSNEKNNLFVLQPIQSTTSNSTSSFSSDESSIYFLDSMDESTDIRKMNIIKSNKRRKNNSSSEKKHLCPYCEHRSKRKHNLIEHILTHNPHRPKKFLCSHCSRPFARKYDMKRHEKIHTR